MTDFYLEWRDFYHKHVSSWMSLEELRAECGKLQTVDNPSPEVLLIHAMHALEELQAEVALERNLKADAIHACALANIRAERLAEALRDAPGGHSCEEFHHRKSDRHLPGEPCPPQVRWHKALATLRDHDQEEGK